MEFNYKKQIEQIKLLQRSCRVLLFYDFDNIRNTSQLDLIVDNIKKAEAGLIGMGFIEVKKNTWVKYFLEINNWISIVIYQDCLKFQKKHFEALEHGSSKSKISSEIKIISKSSIKVFLKINNYFEKIKDICRKYFIKVNNKKFIIFIGPDGSGKTTLSKELCKLRYFNYQYMGPAQYKLERNNPFKKILIYLENFRSQTKRESIRGKLARFLFFIILYFDSIFRFYKQYFSFKAYFVLMDRFPIDIYIRHPTKIRKNLFVNFFPYPKHIFLLKGNSYLINKRKDNLTKEKIDELYGKYELIFKKKKIKLNHIFTTKESLDITLNNFLKKLYEKSLLPL